MNNRLPQQIDRDAPLFPIRVAAQLAGMHPQTLRQYDRLGLVVPSRTKGRGRRYSANDIARLRLIQQLSQEEGINLNGIERILELESELAAARRQVAQLTELIEAAMGGSARTFTADVHGHVAHGRTRAVGLRALPGR